MNEFRLFQLRHWNLIDSLYHSPYVATSLGIWKEKGRQKLLNLLAKMGFPQSECLLPWTVTSLKIKNQLEEKLCDNAERYNMPMLAFPSWSRRFGYKTAISAMDVVYSMTSLLYCASEWMASYAGGEMGVENGVKAGRLACMLNGYSNAEESVGGRGFGQQQGVGAGTRTGVAAVGLRLQEFSQELKAIKDMQEDEQDFEWVRNFWIAYDSLEKFDFI